MNWMLSAMTSAQSASRKYSPPSVGPIAVMLSWAGSIGAALFSASLSGTESLANDVCVSMVKPLPSDPAVLIRSSARFSGASAAFTASVVTGCVKATSTSVPPVKVRPSRSICEGWKPCPPWKP